MRFGRTFANCDEAVDGVIVGAWGVRFARVALHPCEMLEVEVFMLRCGEQFASFLLGRRSAYTSIVLRLRGHSRGHVRLDDVAADQLVGGLLVSAADMLRLGTNETLGFYLEAGVDGLRDAGEDLGAFVGSMAALFVDMADDVSRTFPAEHRAEVLPWLEAFSSECVGGSVRVWRGGRI